MDIPRVVNIDFLKGFENGVQKIALEWIFKEQHQITNNRPGFVKLSFSYT